MMVLIQDKSKVLLDPMIFFGKCFEWRLKVDWKDRRDELLSWKNFELSSNLDRSKWYKCAEVENIFLTNEEEASKLFWLVCMGAESWFDSKEKNEERNECVMGFLR